MLVSIGLFSLQGDTRFAKEVLEPTVVQTATETTVTGPPIGTLKAVGEVDMGSEPMTDAFLVATDCRLGGEGERLADSRNRKPVHERKLVFTSNI